jgi:hypothetical protein
LALKYADPFRLQGALKWKPEIDAAAKRYGVDPRLALSVMAIESGGDSNAVSSAGAIGLMQLMPGTAASLGVDPFDPAQNIDGGVHYLAEMGNRFSWDLGKTLAAYNAGPNNLAGADPAYLPAYLEYFNMLIQGASLNSHGDMEIPSGWRVGQGATAVMDPTTGALHQTTAPEDYATTSWTDFFTVKFWKTAAVWVVLVLIGIGVIYIGLNSMAKGEAA